MFNGENVYKNVSIVPWCRYKLLDIVSGQINNKTVKNSDHTVEKNPCKAKVCVTCQEMMLLVALMILWQHRTLSHPLRPQRQTFGSVSFFILALTHWPIASVPRNAAQEDGPTDYSSLG